MGGDWNRDIRTHKLSVALIKFLGARVVFMHGRVHLPKDFCILKGVSGQSCGMWLREVGDPGGRLQPVLMRPTPQLSFKTRGGGGGSWGGPAGVGGGVPPGGREGVPPGGRGGGVLAGGRGGVWPGVMGVCSQG